MKRSVQEIVELLVFGLIALLIGTGLLWLAGWIFDLVGVLFKFFAALIWSLLRFIVPVAVGAAIVYALVRLIQQQREKSAVRKASGANDAKAAEPVTPAESAAPPPPVDTIRDVPPEGESHPTASEVWAPPQPSPPTSSSETLEEPRVPDDSRPVGEPTPGAAPSEEHLPPEPGSTSTYGEPAPDAASYDDTGVDSRNEPEVSPLDPSTAGEQSTGSVPPADDGTAWEYPGEDRPAGDEGAGTEDEKRDS